MSSGILLGIDVGTSSIKVALVDAKTGEYVAHATSPQAGEIPLSSPQPGWAEQDPEDWWNHTVAAINQLKQSHDLSQVQAIGVAYQMHGLVLLDQNNQVVRPAIIWCDSRAVEIGESLYSVIGPDYAARNLLNHPGNFTASKIAWVAQNEPDNFSKAVTAMLPGDYIAYRLTGAIATSQGGLSEMTLWDFESNDLARKLYANIGATTDLFPTVLPTFSNQEQNPGGQRTDLGLPATAPVTYRAGDQPNNALSLGVLNPGEAATTAGTSGVVYAVTEKDPYDDQGRVNTFLHVNHTPQDPRRGVLLCLNGCGSLYSWLRRSLTPEGTFQHLNTLAEQAPPGADGLHLFPYGNGAERTLGNRNPGASVHHLDFNRHTPAHLARAGQEGIVYALADGLEVMAKLGSPVNHVKAGRANLFLSELFCQIFCNVTGCDLSLYESDGAFGAAIGAGIGAGLMTPDIFKGVPKPLSNFSPKPQESESYKARYQAWKVARTALLNRPQ